MTKMFPAVILAGGLATRLHPLTQTLPKALIPINGEPFIFHQLRLLKQQGIEKVVLCLGHLGEMIEKEVGHGEKFGLSIRCIYDGKALQGTGGAVKRALAFLPHDFFILYGDSYLTCDYAAVQQAYLTNRTPGLMTVFHNQGQWDKSNVEYADHKIITYNKEVTNERMQHIDYGLSVMNNAIFQLVPNEGPYDLASLYQILVNNQKLSAFEVKERFYEIGSFAGIKELEDYLSKNKRDVS